MKRIKIPISKNYYPLGCNYFKSSVINCLDNCKSQDYRKCSTRKLTKHFESYLKEQLGGIN